MSVVRKEAGNALCGFVEYGVRDLDSCCSRLQNLACGGERVAERLVSDCVCAAHGVQGTRTIGQGRFVDYHVCRCGTSMGYARC